MTCSRIPHRFGTTLLALVATPVVCQAEDFPRLEHATLDEQPYRLGELLFEDDFSEGLDQWQAEGVTPPTITDDGRMEFDTPSGLTVWLKERLSGNVMIEYERLVWAKGGPNDRVSDVNCFWMATDPEHPDDFFARSEWRAGEFRNYASLKLYYVGYGGGHNTTCRFRRYTGQAPPPDPIAHYDGNPHYLIVPNHRYTFRLVFFDGLVHYIRDGEVIFEYEDPEPYAEGHFGFRTVFNHEFIDKVKVYRLEPRP